MLSHKKICSNKILSSRIADLHLYMSCVMRKPTFCICKNKDADQLRGNHEADQRLCFLYINTIPILPKSEISSLSSSSVAAKPGLCRTWSETPEDQFSHNEAHILMQTAGFLMTIVKMQLQP